MISTLSVTRPFNRSVCPCATSSSNNNKLLKEIHKSELSFYLSDALTTAGFLHMVVLGKHEQPFRGPRSSPPYPPPPQLAAISKAKKSPKQNKTNPILTRKTNVCVLWWGWVYRGLLAVVSGWPGCTSHMAV